jgi:hypothetical protein
MSTCKNINCSPLINLAFDHYIEQLLPSVTQVTNTLPPHNMDKGYINGLVLAKHSICYTVKWSLITYLTLTFVVQWFSSNLTHRTQSVCINGVSSWCFSTILVFVISCWFFLPYDNEASKAWQQWSMLRLFKHKRP